MTTHAIDCERFDEWLADYLEDDLAMSEQRAAEAHVASCVRCAALVRDLERIRTAAGELSELTPSVDLWDGIAQRIDAPVVPLVAPATPNAVAGLATRRRAFDRLRVAAVAAALVAVTAGVTYTLTVSRNAARDGGVPIASNALSALAGDSARDAAPRTAMRGQPSSPSVDPAATSPDEPSQTAGARSTARNIGNSQAAPVEDTDAREIDRLRTVFARSRSQLDPRTAAIIEANLKVIDAAIAQSKAALAQDPASRFLNDQLKSVVDKKLELLRTAVQLPSRT